MARSAGALENITLKSIIKFTAVKNKTKQLSSNLNQARQATRSSQIRNIYCLGLNLDPTSILMIRKSMPF